MRGGGVGGGRREPWLILSRMLMEMLLNPSNHHQKLSKHKIYGVLYPAFHEINTFCPSLPLKICPRHSRTPVNGK